MFEMLEGRRMFSVALNGTDLQVTGDTGATPNDVVRITQQDAATIRVEENGVVTFFNTNSVARIVVNAGTGNDTVNISPAVTKNAVIDGGAGDDDLSGGSGNDVINGGAVNASVNGGSGNDVLDAGAGNNRLRGGAGNDRMTAGLGADDFDGNGGVDTVDYSARTDALKITLDGSANDGGTFFQPTTTTSRTLAGPILQPPALQVSEGDNVRETVENVNTGAGNDLIVAGSAPINNTFNGGAGDDRIEGRDGNDTINGRDGDDLLLGGKGSDFISGGNGNDRELGGAGSDIVIGGDGNDILTGGAGADAIRGDAGDDLVVATDNFSDASIDGGAGFDILDADDVDPLSLGFELFA
jgi:Ca2+-binding RTX toxin-like protein